MIITRLSFQENYFLDSIDPNYSASKNRWNRCFRAADRTKMEGGGRMEGGRVSFLPLLIPFAYNGAIPLRTGVWWVGQFGEQFDRIPFNGDARLRRYGNYLLLFHYSRLKLMFIKVFILF